MLIIGFFLGGMGYVSCCAMNCAFFMNRNLVVTPDEEPEDNDGV